eukprot:scaffold57908_cov24-Attheya_sp.AAC.1
MTNPEKDVANCLIDLSKGVSLAPLSSFGDQDQNKSAKRKVEGNCCACRTICLDDGPKTKHRRNSKNKRWTENGNGKSKKTKETKLNNVPNPSLEISVNRANESIFLNSYEEVKKELDLHRAAFRKQHDIIGWRSGSNTISGKSKKTKEIKLNNVPNPSLEIS